MDGSMGLIINFGLACCLICLIGCETNNYYDTTSITPPVDPDEPYELSINSEWYNPFLGFQSRFDVYAHFANYVTRDWTDSVTWSISDTNIATITPQGVLTPKAQGMIVIRATSTGGLADDYQMEIRRPERVQLAVENSVIFLGQARRVRIQLSSNYNSVELNSASDVAQPGAMQWVITDSTVLGVVALDSLRPRQVGQATISLRVDDVGSNSLNLVVDSVIALTIFPNTPQSLFEQDTMELMAVAQGQIMQQHLDRDDLIWAATGTALVAFENGRYVALSPGLATVTAQYRGIVSPPLDVTVAALDTLLIEPIASIPNPVAQGAAVGFTVAAHADDGSIRDMTDHVEWLVSPNTHADFGAPGMLGTQTPGSYTIWARRSRFSTDTLVVKIAGAHHFLETFESYRAGPFSDLSRKWSGYFQQSGVTIDSTGENLKRCVFSGQTNFYLNHDIEFGAGLNPAIELELFPPQDETGIFSVRALDVPEIRFASSEIRISGQLPVAWYDPGQSALLRIEYVQRTATRDSVDIQWNGRSISAMGLNSHDSIGEISLNGYADSPIWVDNIRVQ
jgi:hypothetical protein